MTQHTQAADIISTRAVHTAMAMSVQTRGEPYAVRLYERARRG